jgi:hypothetical protein
MQPTKKDRDDTEIRVSADSMDDRTNPPTTKSTALNILCSSKDNVAKTATIENNNNQVEVDDINNNEEEEAVLPLDWFRALHLGATDLATSLRDTAGGVVGFVRQSALSVAAEMADFPSAEIVEPLKLPWEIMSQDGTYQPDDVLKTTILALSSVEATFLRPFQDSSLKNAPDDDFVLDEPHVQLIRYLLELDANLARTHARLSGRSTVREGMFWKNYFYHADVARKTRVDALRAESNMANDSLVDGASSVGDDSSYVCVDSKLPPSAPSSMNLPSAPSSSNSLLLIQSVGDLVVVGSPSKPGLPVKTD